jgi:hypothetical protein
LYHSSYHTFYDREERKVQYVDALREKRQAVWEELEELRAEQKRVAERVGVKEAQLRNLDELLSMEGAGPAVSNGADGVRSGVSFLDRAVEVLAETRGGLHYRELVERLNADGVNVPGQDPGANLIAHLTRDARFIRVGRGTYGLRNVHKAAASGRTATRRRRKSVRATKR